MHSNAYLTHKFVNAKKGNAKCNSLKVPTFSTKKNTESEFDVVQFLSQDLRVTNFELQSVK